MRSLEEEPPHPVRLLVNPSWWTEVKRALSVAPSKEAARAELQRQLTPDIALTARLYGLPVEEDPDIKKWVCVWSDGRRTSPEKPTLDA